MCEYCLKNETFGGLLMKIRKAGHENPNRYAEYIQHLRDNGIEERDIYAIEKILALECDGSIALLRTDGGAQ